MFMNSNSLPIALMQSLVVTVPGLKWGDDDNEDAMVGRALTYLVLYSTLGMVVRWSYGVRLLSQADPESSETTNEATAHTPLLDREEVAFPPSEEEAHLHQYKPSSESPETGSQTDVEYPSIIVHSSNAADPKFFYSFPNSPQRSTQALRPSSTSSSSSLVQQDEEDDGEEEGLDDGELEIRRRRRRNPLTPSTSRTRSFFRRTSHKLRKAWRTFNEFMTVPLWAALASLLVACIQPLQHTLEEHVEPVKGALTQAGNVSIPLTLVVLGAYFYTPLTPEQRRESLPQHQHQPSTSTSASALAEEQEAERGRSRSELSLVDNVREMFKMGVRNASRDWRRRKQMNKEAKRPGETKTVVVAILSRMILTPLLLLPLMAVGARWDLQEVFAE
ncbi:hypothetical protein K474DRAFT_1665581 [Panus rudis PR-1116 ss-1]|nr:hypothetical protein K474DRAFT_1665581 [Panus rudis PR-1116 ss-1]